MKFFLVYALLVYALLSLHTDNLISSGAAMVAGTGHRAVNAAASGTLRSSSHITGFDLSNTQKKVNMLPRRQSSSYSADLNLYGDGDGDWANPNYIGSAGLNFKAHIQDETFWRELAPKLHIYDRRYV